MAAKRKAAPARKAQAKKKPAVRPAASANAAWAQQSAKLYPFGASAQDATKAATEQMQSAAEQMMQYGSQFMNQVLSKAPLDFSAVQDKVAANAAANGFAKVSDTAARSMNDVAEISRGGAEAITECGNVAVAATQQISAEIASYVNKAFNTNVELSKQALACRTLNDMFDLNNAFVKSNLDAFFTESVKLSELLFQAASDVAEPISERLNEATERMSKAFSA